jgi:hypothetical protein
MQVIKDSTQRPPQAQDKKDSIMEVSSKTLYSSMLAFSVLTGMSMLLYWYSTK